MYIFIQWSEIHVFFSFFNCTLSLTLSSKRPALEVYNLTYDSAEQKVMRNRLMFF